MSNRDTPSWKATNFRILQFPNEAGVEEVDTVAKTDWTPVITSLLLGARDINSPMSLLRGKEQDILKRIVTFLVYKYQEGAVTITPPARTVTRKVLFLEQEDVDEEKEYFTTNRGATFPLWNALVRLEGFRRISEPEQSRNLADRPQVAYTACGLVSFPHPQGININMMPFTMGNRSSLPLELWSYYDMIISECPIHESEQGKVMYLTVQESLGGENDTKQRKRGLRIEAPMVSMRSSGDFVAGAEYFDGDSIAGYQLSPDELHGGLYLASNRSGTIAVWDASVDPTLGAVETDGGIEHLRPFIGKGKTLRCHQLVWMTDRTPYEELPKEPTYVNHGCHQFFQLVTADISVWFAEHSTPNPKVPVPAHVKIIGESNWKKAC